MPLFSTPQELNEIRDLSRNFLRLPFGYKSIPGNLLEAIIEVVKGGDVKRLNTYDFVDVISRSEKIGWQVKSLSADTPVTWIRGKLPGKQALINESFQSDEAKQLLGDTILDYCNAHVIESMKKYELERIGYLRLINFQGRFRYFEIPLVDDADPILFKSEHYQWNWSVPKATGKKEQLSAFHGTHILTGIKHFAWHGQGENQLHFTGEKTWWPENDYPHALSFDAPSDVEMVSLETLAEWLATLQQG